MKKNYLYKNVFENFWITPPPPRNGAELAQAGYVTNWAALSSYLKEKLKSINSCNVVFVPA